MSAITALLIGVVIGIAWALIKNRYFSDEERNEPGRRLRCYGDGDEPIL